MLTRLYYLSQISEGIGKDDFEAILTKSRRNNRPLGITGLLVVKDRYFIQALEGDRETVHQLYEKIAIDPRHRCVVILAEENTEERIFPEWDMGFRHLNETGAELPEIDLAAPKYVDDPTKLNVAFKRFMGQVGV